VSPLAELLYRPRTTVPGVGCLIIVFLVLAVAFAGIGFAAHVLWIAAAVFFVAWLAGYAFARGQRRAWRRRRD
jgi:hypothetical protein